MNRRDFPHLESVEDQANVTVPGKPDPVRLIRCLVPVASVDRMPTHIKHGGKSLARLDAGRPVKIARHVQSRTALVMDHVDHKAVALVRSGDDRFQWCFRRQWPQPEHLEIFFPVLRAKPFPFFKRLDVILKAGVDLLGLPLQISLNHAIPGLATIGLSHRLWVRRLMDDQDQQGKQLEAEATGHGNLLAKLQSVGNRLITLTS